jgi:hypothetical protein
MLLLQKWNKAKQLLFFCLDRHYHYILLISIVSLILSSKEITCESTVLLQSDMSRYMMNGVYFYDLFRDLPLSNFIPYTVQYFARYPALSLGHHPILPGVALVPFYAIFGISVFSARLMVVTFMLLAGIFWYLLIKLLYDKNIALLSSLLFVTTPFVVFHSRIVMSEIPCLAMIILTFYFLCQFCSSEEKKYLIAFAIASVASVYAKQPALFMFPFYFLYFVMTKGIRNLLRKDILIVSIIIALLISPLIPMTLKFSQYNVALTQKVVSQTSQHIPFHRFYSVIKSVYQSHLSEPVLILSLFSICAWLFRRDKRDTIFLLWIIIFYVFSVYFRFTVHRYTIYWIPAFCLLSTTIINVFNHRLWKVLITSIIILISGYQFTLAFQSSPNFAHGFEETAKYVVDNWKGDSVLYNFYQDPGYFIFFVRKYDQNQNRIVLRADKILATNQMARIIEERIHSKKEIYDILDKFGVAYVVTINLKFTVPILEQLNEVVHSEKFILRKRIPIHVSDQKVPDLYLSIYEYKGYIKASPDAVLSMNIPLMGDSISIPFKDLINKNAQ